LHSQLAWSDRPPTSLLPLLHPVDSEPGGKEFNSHLTYERAIAPGVGTGMRASPLTNGMELAGLMHDLGYSCCANAKSVGEVLAQFAPLDAASIGAMVTMMARTASGLDDSLSLYGAFSTAVSGRYLEFDAKFDADKEDAERALTSWNSDAFVEAVRETSPRAWPEIIRHLDAPDLEIPSAAGLALITGIHRHAVGAPLPVVALLWPWKNVHAQLQAVCHLLGPSRATAHVDWSAGARVAAHMPLGASKAELAHWSCLELTGCLLHLSAHGLYAPVQVLFDEALSSCPQQLLAALLQMASPGMPVQTAPVTAAVNGGYCCRWLATE
jgi:hypothetical protein